MNDLELHLGDCKEILKQLPDESVYCCVTSPPYYGLRNYDDDRQLGAEDTPKLYVDNLIKVFKEAVKSKKIQGFGLEKLVQVYSTFKS